MEMSGDLEGRMDKESKLGDEICNKYGAAVYIVNNAIYSVNAQLDVPLY